MEKNKLEPFPEGVLEHVARTISNYRTGSEIGELLRIAGYSKESLFAGTKWRFLYGTFKQFQASLDGQYHIAKVIQAFCDPTQWIGRLSSHKQALDTLDEGLIYVNLQVNKAGKLVVTQERITHVVQGEMQDESSEHEHDSARPSDMTDELNRRRVFVVYGRNEKIRRGIFSFIRALGLDPIEWIKAVEMTGKATPYVGEILDNALANAQAIVVVMTPDDEARLRQLYVTDSDPEYERELTPQPRSNVLFEAGLALGRAPDQTVLVEVGHNRPFSDIAGRHTIRLDNSTEKRHALASRLKSAGCSVDFSGTDWHTEGDFEISGADTRQDMAGQAAVDTPNLYSGHGFTNELTESEVKILNLMAQIGDTGLTIAELATEFHIHQTKAEYLLEQL